MRRHPKASAARSTLDATVSRVRSGRVVATRGALGDRKGIGAPSRRRLSAIALAATALALLAFAPLSQAKVVVNGFGTAGTLGGQFGTAPSGIAVNNSGNGVAAGTTYVVDSNQNRVERFSPSGEFERTWGFDVETGGSTGFEICTVAANCKAGIATPATANGGQLNNPQGVAVNQATGNVYVTEATNRRISEFDANGNFLRTWGWDVSSSEAGTGFEICEVAANCKTAAAAGSGGGQFGANLSQPAIDSAGNVWVYDTGNLRIQEFSSTGAFIAAYGFNVDKGGALEECTSTAVGICGPGTSGSGAGQFSSTTGKANIAFDSSGNVYVTDVGNNRVQKFNPTLTTATTFGASTLAAFTTAAPEAMIATQGGARLVIAVNNSVNVSPSERQIVELDLSANVTDTSLVGSGLNAAVGGLGVNETSGNLYASTNASASPRKVLTLSATPLPDPALVLNPITTKTDTTATFSGSVDPRGGLVSCNFQYSTDQVNWTSVAIPACQTLPPGGGVQAVSANVIGLDPNTHYFVRLAVSRPLVANSTKMPSDQEFNTNAVPPVVSNVGAIEISNTSVRLVGTIDPRHAETSYVFEYGTTPLLSSATAPVEIGDGTTPLIVSQVIEGLSPNTTYHYSLVATSTIAPTASPLMTFTTRATAATGTARAYEQVTPIDKNFGRFTTNSAVAPGGEAVSFCNTSGFSDPVGQIPFVCVGYVSRRSDSGWVTTSPVGPLCRGGLGSLQAPVLSPDLEDMVFIRAEEASCVTPPLDPAAPLPAENLYRRGIDNQSESSLLTPVVAPFGNTFAASAEDFNRIFYTSKGEEVPGAPAGVNGSYEWHAGSVSLISRGPAGQPLPAASTLASQQTSVNGVSTSGDRAYFENGGELYLRENGDQAQSAQALGSATGAGNLTAGSNQVTSLSTGSGTFAIGQTIAAAGVPAGTTIAALGSGTLTLSANATAAKAAAPLEAFSACTEAGKGCTVRVSEPECSGCAVATGSFEWATADGDKALLLSTAKLTEDDTSSTGNDLYLYNRSANPLAGDNLTLLSRDNEPADGTTAGVLGVSGISEDGNTVFFVASGQIVAGEPVAAGPKVYRWRWNGGSPTVQYLATLGSGAEDKYAWENPTNNAIKRPVDSIVTADGRRMILQTTAALDPVADTDTALDVYRWDEGEGWTCLSCQVPGTPSAGPSTLRGGEPSATASGVSAAVSNYQQRLVMTANGDTVFFTSDDSLLPGDTNNGRQDIYEWHEGHLSLITSGTTGFEEGVVPNGASTDNLLLGISASGRDVFFTTSDRLVGWDTDENEDLYDARVGGGFPEPPAKGSPCESEACRAAGTVAPPAAGAATAAFQGPGNAGGQVSCPKNSRKVTKKGKTVCQHKKKHGARKHKKHNRRHARSSQEVGK